MYFQRGSIFLFNRIQIIINHFNPIKYCQCNKNDKEVDKREFVFFLYSSAEERRCFESNTWTQQDFSADFGADRGLLCKRCCRNLKPSVYLH